MTPLQTYSALIDPIFGVGTTKFDITKDVTNTVIGAINNQTEFLDFKNNFTARLNRLKNIYSTHPTYLKEIITQVNEIASEKNWEGAFAELSAFDHLNQDILNHKTNIHTPIKPNETIDKSRTFALELGKAAANLDGFIEETPTYLDFKVFKDNVSEIFEKLYKELHQHFNRDDFRISAEYDLAISVDEIAPNIAALRNELITGIIPTNKTTYLKSSVVSNLNFRILWGRGVLAAERTHNPFRHAENYHQMVFKNADQFVKDNPSLMVYVIFPWYNGIVSSFSNSNIKLYRSLSRRVFCQYKHDSTLFKTFNSKFTGSQTIYQISNFLSGIIFLEDNTILSKEPNQTNVKSYVYLNPNAINSLNRSLVQEFLLGLHNSEYDDFENDNY
ncbi:MAG: hypothetical protein NT126_07660 [Bacteroidetes bacterium]|nr:hypothetical protein [Bacteroidota bacterium]